MPSSSATILVGVLFAIAGGTAAAADWPSPVTWKPDERAISSGLYIEAKPLAKRAKVEFTVAEPSGVKRQDCPVRGAIPIYRGELADPKNIRLLDSAGKEVPVQGMISGFWPEKTARFLCIDFVADLDAKQEKKFTLEYGTDVKPAAGQVKVKASGDKGAEVGTGVATLKFKTGTDFMQVSLEKPAQSFKPVTGRALVAKDEKGANPATHALTIDQVIVAEEGPAEATVHLVGHYGEQKANPPANPNNDIWRFPCSMWVRVYGGTGHAYIEHAFGYNGDEYSDFVTSYGLVVPTGAKSAKFIYGPDDSSQKESALGVRLNQYAHNEWTLSGKAGESGKRIGGWAAIKGTGTQVVGSVREAWQNWPVAFSGQDNGDLIVEILGEAPERGLDLRWHEQGDMTKLHKTHSFFYGDKDDDDYDTTFRDGRPAGIMKIHEIMLDFSAGTTPALDIGRAFQVPLVPWPGQQRYEQTKAFGHIAVYGDPKNDYLKNYFSVMLDILPVVHEANGLYGWVDWGDVPMCDEPQGGKFKMKMAGGVGWGNGERAVASYFYHYVAGGGRRFLDYGRAMVYQTLGIDVEHEGGDAGKAAAHRLGAYHRHTQVHWRSDGGLRQGGFRGWYNYFWLSGDQEVREEMLKYGIDAPAHNMVMDLRAEQPVPNINHDSQSSAPTMLAHCEWIATGDWRYARAHHAIARLWEIGAEKGMIPEDGWKFFQVKDNEPVGYSLWGGSMWGYWYSYGEDDVLLDWISLTGDPAAINGLTAQSFDLTWHNHETYLYISPEALFISLAALKKDHPKLKEWMDFRLWKHANLKKFKERNPTTTGEYKSAEEWDAYRVNMYGKNGLSVNGSEAIEILLLMKAQEVLDKGAAALK